MAQGRWVQVAPARLTRWIDGFAERHGAPRVSVAPGAEPGLVGALRLDAPDGAMADLYPPPGAPPVTAEVEAFVARARAPRRLGLLLARRGAVAVGVADGDALILSKVDSSYVQGRTAAGGWSQQRFARRRENQAKAAAGSAADIAARLLLPAVGSLAAVVTGGDRRAVRAVLADRRLTPVVALVTPRFLEVAEPRQAVLVSAVAEARAVHIWIMDPIVDPAD